MSDDKDLRHYLPQWREIHRRRLGAWRGAVVTAIGLGALWMLEQFVDVPLWVAVAIRVGVGLTFGLFFLRLAGTFPCPRCGKPFNYLRFGDQKRRIVNCVHCGLARVDDH